MQQLHDLVVAVDQATRPSFGYDVLTIAPLVDFIYEPRNSGLVSQYVGQVCSQRGRSSTQSWLQTVQQQGVVQLCKLVLELRIAGAGDNALRTFWSELMKAEQQTTYLSVVTMITQFPNGGARPWDGLMDARTHTALYFRFRTLLATEEAPQHEADPEVLRLQYHENGTACQHPLNDRVVRLEAE
eukprot:1617-Heterococcus_DN1.PRE.1